MAKAPAVVIVVRHGARLDAADQSWHLSSPTPYDPPLTYGGWIQSRALGLRIASLLHEREKGSASSGTSSPAAPPTDPGLGIKDFAYLEANIAARSTDKSRTKRRKHKVVIHSSPFQRCVQTGIGISAGLSQYQGLPANARKSSDARIKTLGQLRGSPSLRPRDASASPQLRPVPEHDTESRDLLRSSLKEKDSVPPSRATLRVDAFLGEWLSPDYFEMITPPPESTLMVAAAKAELLRQADKIETYTPSSPVVSGGNLWGTPPAARQHSHSVSNVPSPLSQETNGPLENWQVFSRDVPSRDRTNSLGTNKSPEQFRPADPSNLSHKHDNSSGYTPPTPTYAISPGDPIPRGYVAHARDQCVKVDYKWDSMREPHCWGDGGRFGEEWSQMHKRFRHGLSSMVDWYATTRSDSKYPTHDHHEAAPEEDDDEDLVVVLITHGAGCNALIGGLTNQPVLLDFGMASLTMAVRKDDPSTSPSEGEHRSPIDSPASSSPALDPVDAMRRPLPRRQSSIDAGLSSHYEMKIIASSEHLRPGVDPSRAPAPTVSSPILSASQTVPQSRSRRFGSASSHTSAGAPVDSSWNLPEPRARINSSLGSMRRPSRPVITPVVSSPAIPSAVRNDSPTGLWGSMSAKDVDSPNFLNTLARSNSLAARLSAPKATTPERSVSPKADFRSAPAESEASALKEEAKSNIAALPTVDEAPPPQLARSLSQKGLWGSAPKGAFPREAGVPKRRWTVVQD
ncbi:hypothetical protein E4T52_13985 [Aureobasidium sp. EXF-3400]|nr:hypothetical protein E4T51_11826 [Aureobasidium sp. EXF-12344]KAI4771003.1 hypothetical protein E4T52_13985 [Aureobasidium sp. EXF-3400]